MRALVIVIATVVLLSSPALAQSRAQGQRAAAQTKERACRTEAMRHGQAGSRFMAITRIQLENAYKQCMARRARNPR
jgi:hypothetical protein